MLGLWNGLLLIQSESSPLIWTMLLPFAVDAWQLTYAWQGKLEDFLPWADYQPGCFTACPALVSYAKWNSWQHSSVNPTLCSALDFHHRLHQSTAPPNQTPQPLPDSSWQRSAKLLMPMDSQHMATTRPDTWLSLWTNVLTHTLVTLQLFS